MENQATVEMMNNVENLQVEVPKTKKTVKRAPRKNKKVDTEVVDSDVETVENAVEPTVEPIVVDAAPSPVVVKEDPPVTPAKKEEEVTVEVVPDAPKKRGRKPKNVKVEPVQIEFEETETESVSTPKSRAMNAVKQKFEPMLFEMKEQPPKKVRKPRTPKEPTKESVLKKSKTQLRTFLRNTNEILKLVKELKVYDFSVMDEMKERYLDCMTKIVELCQKEEKEFMPNIP